MCVCVRAYVRACMCLSVCLSVCLWGERQTDTDRDTHTHTKTRERGGGEKWRRVRDWRGSEREKGGGQSQRGETMEDRRVKGLRGREWVMD